MEKTIKELWTERATELGKEPIWIEAHCGKLPPQYTPKLDWSLAAMEPLGLPPDVTPEAAEMLFYERYMESYRKTINEVLPLIKRTEPQKHKQLVTLLQKIDAEEPSNTLLSTLHHFKTLLNATRAEQQAAGEAQKVLDDDLDMKLREIGKRFYKVKHSGKAVLYDVDNDEWTFYDDCRTHYGHMRVGTINDAGKPTVRNIFDVFREWRDAPRYDQVVFNPRKDGHYDASFNLWQGIQVQPEDGDDDLLLWELLEKICDGNDQYFDYVQKWLAHMVQKPWELPGTAIGISGKQGLGKNAFVETVGMLLSTPQMIDLMNRRSGATLGKVLSTGAFGYFTSYDEVFGNFNALAGNKLLLLLDEATWGGFHDQKARLKTAITGQTVTINDKFMRQLPIANCRRFVFLSNDGYYIGVDPDDRRLLPLEFKAENRPSDDWFNQFYRDRAKGKMIQNLLYRLQHLDISTWEPMRALKEVEITTGAAIQTGSAPDYVHWLADMAETGTMLMKVEMEEFDTPVCNSFITESDLKKSYQLTTGRKDVKGWNRHEFVELRDKVLGEKRQKRVSEVPEYGRHIPSIHELRKRVGELSRWKFRKFAEITEPAADDDGAKYPRSANVTRIRDKVLVGMDD